MAKKANLKVLKSEAIQKQQKMKDFEFKNVSDIIPFTIPSKNLKYFKEEISKVSNVEIKLVEDSKSSKDSKIVHIQAKEVVAIDSMKFGMILSDAAKTAAEKVKEDKAIAAAKSVKKPVRFVMPKDTALSFREGCKDGIYPFEVLRYSYKSDKECHVWLNTSHVQGRAAYTAFVMKVADTINSIKTGFRKKIELAWIESGALKLETAVMTKESEQYVQMTGQEMIDLDICNVFDIDSKTMNNFQKLLKALFRKRKFQYMYHGQLVLPSQTYIVFLDEAREIETQEVNHLHEMLLRYEFGENVHSGFGLKLVKNYYEEIAELYNLNMAQSQQEEPTDISKN